MKEEFKVEGIYELFKSTNGQIILNLDNQAYYFLPGGWEGEKIESTDPDPDKDSSISVGKYYFFQEGDTNDFTNPGRIFLEDGPQYREIELPEGLPTKNNEPQKKLVHTGKRHSKYHVLDKIKK